MSFLQTIKNVVAWEKDEDFFDKEATIKEYFKVCPPEKRRKVSNYDELYLEALKYVKKQSFEENTKDMEDYFYEMTMDEGVVAVCIGIFAYNIACDIDKNGKEWEKKLDKKVNREATIKEYLKKCPPEERKKVNSRDELYKVAKKYVGKQIYDRNNPFDKRLGKNHRTFGHDIFAFGLKSIPNDYPVYKEKIMGINDYETIGEYLSKEDGRITMLDLIWHEYGAKENSLLEGIFSCVGHTVVHFAKDLLTPDGVPLPFSSLKNDYIPLEGDDIFDQNDYILENKFNEWVDKYNGNMKASDFVTLGFIESMCKLYTAQKKLGEKAESFNRDLKIIAMGTCIMIQMSSMILNQKNIIKKGKDKGKKAMVPGAKWNVILTGAMMKAMTQEMTEVTKVRKEVNKSYSQKINEVKTNE